MTRALTHKFFKVYLAAADQLLTVATYAKIGNELNTLNNTSWIATA